MSIAFLLEEIDEETRDYLLAVRERKGRGMPGVYAPLNNSLPVLGCVVGPIVVVATLILTLTGSIGVVFDDPSRVALLQTAGLVLGGWMFIAALRIWASGRSTRTAGYWVYADPAYLYEATGERVIATSLDDLRGAKYKHVYNENKYQSTTVTIMLSRRRTRVVKIGGEEEAETLVAFLNYIYYVFGPDGGTRADLPFHDLGALAAYVARNEDEPLNLDGKLDLDQLPSGWKGKVPEKPERTRRAVPHVIPYIVILLAGLACFFAMRTLNVRARDHAIYDAVTTEPIEPRYLRAYLIDPRNTRHRGSVADRLAAFYDPTTAALRQRPDGGTAKDGLIELLHSVRTADQAVVSIRVVEVKPPAGLEAGSPGRVKIVREGVVARTAQALNNICPKKIDIPFGVIIDPPPPPVGEQLLIFVEAPEDAPNPHLDLHYSFEPDKNGKYRVSARIDIRVNVAEEPVAFEEVTLPRAYGPDEMDTAAADLAAAVVRSMAGEAAGQPLAQPWPPPFPGFGP